MKTYLVLAALLLSKPAHAVDLATLLNQTRTTANGTFTTSDDRGSDLDGLQITQVNTSSFIAVYHHYTGPSSDDFQVNVATSTSAHGPWTYRVSIDNSKASQPELKMLSDGKFILAYEKKNGNISIMTELFNDYNSLMSNTPSRTYLLPRPSGAKTIGTPNFRWVTYDGNVDTMKVEMGMHQNRGGNDSEGLGFMTGFRSFSFQANTDLQNAVSQYCKGNIGDRTFMVVNGLPYTLIEGQVTKGDWGSWRIFLWDETKKTITALNLKTSGGSVSFGNPSVTLYTGANGEALLEMSTFVFTPSNTPGENAYFANLGDLTQQITTTTPSIAATPNPSPITSTVLTPTQVTGTVITTTGTTTASSSGVFSAGTLNLTSGQMSTITGALTLTMQADGNLVLYQNGKAAWSSNTIRRCVNCLAAFQADGNLVIYNRDNNRAIYATGTDKVGTTLTVTSMPPYVMVKNSSGVQVWPGRGSSTAAAAAAIGGVSRGIASPTTYSRSYGREQLK